MALREDPVDLSIYFAEIRKTPVEEITLKGAMEAIKFHGQNALREMSAEELDNAADALLSLARSIIEGGEDCGGMSIDELAALKMYTNAFQGTSLFRLVNYHLIHTQHLQPFVPYIWLLLLALKKCPVFGGTTVYRGIRLEGQELEAFLSEYKKNARIQWNRLTSTSAIVSVQETFLGKKLVQDGEGNPVRLLSGVMFHIHLRSGARVISQYSNFPEEMEVLLPPGFQFEVVDMVSPYHGLHIIQLIESNYKSPIVDLRVEAGRNDIPRCYSDLDRIQVEFVARLHSLKLANENTDDEVPRDGSVRGVLSGCWRLQEAALRQLFLADVSTPGSINGVRVRRSYPEGRGVRDVAVVKADPESSDKRGLSFHFKSNPEFPFNELAINQLGLMLFGDAVLHDVLELWMCGRWYVFLVSETVLGGKTLAEELRWSDDLPEEERLRLSKNLSRHMCRKSFGRSCLMAMLCRLQDQKPDNVLIREDGTLACIDNERAFVVDRRGYWNGKSEVQSVLFCVNFMCNNIHSDLVDIINGWGEDCEFRLVESWLRRLSDLVEDAEGGILNSGTILGLAPAVLWNLIVGITNIKRYAGNCSYLKLLEILLPQTSRSYGPVLSREESIQKRFGSASEYDGSSQCSKLATSEVMRKVLYERIGPIKGLEWLASSRETVQSPANLLSFAANIKEGILTTSLDMMNMLSKESRDSGNKVWLSRLLDLVRILHQMGLLGHLLAKVDFSRGVMSYKERQMSFLHEMGKFQHSHLVVAYAAHLTVELLQRLLLASPDLIFLALFRCAPSGINLNFPRQGLLKLRQLQIEGMSVGAEVDMSTMLCLAKVELLQVYGLRKLFLSPACVYLDLTDTWTTEMDVIELGQTVGLTRENVIGVEPLKQALFERARTEILKGNLDPLQSLPTTCEIETVLKMLVDESSNTDISITPTASAKLAELTSRTSFHSLYCFKAAWINRAGFVRTVSNSKHLRLLCLKGSNINQELFLGLKLSPTRYLSSLDLSDCFDVKLSAKDIHSVAENLTSLDLSNTATTSFDTVEQGYFYRDSKLYLPLLKRLSLSRCRFLRNFHIQRAYQYLVLPDVTHMNISASITAIPALVSLLGDRNKASRQSAIKTLMVLAVDADYKVVIVGSGAVPQLLSILSKADYATKRVAIGVLKHLTESKGNHIAIANAGAIPSLVRLLDDGDCETRRETSGALRNLALNSDNQITIAGSRAIPSLVRLLDDGDCETRREASGALRNLALNSDNQITIAGSRAIPLWSISHAEILPVSMVIPRDLYLMEDMLSDDDAETSSGASDFLENMSPKSDSQITIRDSGAIPALVSFLKDSDTETRRNASGALKNLAFNRNNQITISNAGAIPALVSLLNDDDVETRREASGALENLSLNKDNQIAIAKAGAIPALVSLLGDIDNVTRVHAADTLENLPGYLDIQVAIEDDGAIPALVDMLNVGYSKTRREASGALRNLALSKENQITIANAGAIPILTNLLHDGDSNTRREASGALRNLALSKENQITIANAGAIPILTNLLHDSKTRREASGALRNLALSKENQIAIANAGAIPILTNLLHDGDSKTRREAAVALKNLSLNRDNHILIASAGAVPALISVLSDYDEQHPAAILRSDGMYL